MSNHYAEIGIWFLTFQCVEVQKRVKNPDNAVTWEVVLAGSYYVETKPEMLVRDRSGETDGARGQGSVVESPQRLLGKCSWMTAFWNFTNGEF